MIDKIKYVLGAVSTATFIAVSALSPTVHAASVTPAVIFGSGNANGDFTVSTSSNVEIGLRGKIPFDGTTNYDGTKTYSFDAGLFPGSTTRPTWNFDWAINVNANNSSDPTRAIGDLTYLLSLDSDPTAGTNFVGSSFDPINSLPLFDHAFGNNSTANGAGVVAGSAVEYAALLAGNNVVQQSWSYGFFLTLLPGLSGFDPFAAGLYTINLQAFDGLGGLLAQSSIDINISAIPVPAALPLFGTGLAILGFAGWRRRRRAIAAT